MNSKDKSITSAIIVPGVATAGRQPSKKLRREVRDAFDGEMLADICVRKDFSEHGLRVDLPFSKFGTERFYYYEDNGSNILGVAHLDSVQRDGHCQITDTAAGLLATSGALDDRLGAYVILDMLPKLGVECDWLLTTDEEICDSTGEDFWPQHKQYNWMFSFDRGGTDVVMYDYETPQLRDLVENAGAQVGKGTFSDICQMEHLECKGFNWGVGYQDYHSSRAHAWLDDTFRMVARFVKFYNTNADLALPHEPYYKSYRSAGSSAWEWDDDDTKKWDEGLIVADCGHGIDLSDDETYIETTGWIVCTKCGSY